MGPTPPPTAGIYLHLPFCHSKCTYCGFVTGSYEDSLSARYVDALEHEIRAFPPPGIAVPDGELHADTLYLGGGTPSIMPPDDIRRLIRACRDRFTLSSDAEITIEVNPSDTGAERLAAFRETGINRVSLGVQSFLDRQLRATGRDHTADEARAAFLSVREAGFDNVSLDLIAGLPHQTLDEWTHNLDEALQLGPEHLSLYLLEVKEGTKLAALIAEGRLPTPDDDLGAEMYKHLLDRLEGEGFDAYEISNFARARRFRSRHNLKYWTDAPFFGFGVGAHGFDGDERYSNTTNIHEYVESVTVRGHALAERTSRTVADKYFEALMMGLRLREGVSLAELKARFGLDVRETHAAELVRLMEAAAVELDGEILRLTRAGTVISNEVFLAFL